MITVNKIKNMQELSRKIHSEGKTIAFVPTMGYFHEGHTSLMKKAKELADVVVTSLFVNPTQFGPNEDFQSYPRDFARDEKIASDNGTDILFYPDLKEMYPKGFNSKIAVFGVSEKFEGASRPGHFNGVALVVAKLFNAVLPDYAVFGQKDYQQTLVIKRMNEDLNFPIKIVIAPTHREESGLARSSRNSYLSPEEKEKASVIYKALNDAAKAIENGEDKRKIINAIMINTIRTVKEFKIDYCMSADAANLDEPEFFLPDQKVVLLIAAYLNKTRLIDNAVVTIPADKNIKPAYFIDGIT